MNQRFSPESCKPNAKYEAVSCCLKPPSPPPTLEICSTPAAAAVLLLLLLLLLLFGFSYLTPVPSHRPRFVPRLPKAAHYRNLSGP